MSGSGSAYKYLTKEVIEQFGGSGTEILLEILESVEESNPDSEILVVQLFTELLLVLDEDGIELNALVTFLFSAIRNDMIARVFCQVINVFPVSEHIKNLLQLITRKENVIKPETIAMYIGQDNLGDSEIVPKVSLIKSIGSKARDQLYSQKKYNLLHEELEGFSKFITEIYFILKADDTEFQVDYAIQVIEKLIGHYSLDPNRCLDLLFEILESHIVSKHIFCIQLLKKSRWWPIEPSDNSSLESLSNGGNETAAKALGLRLVKCPRDRDLPETFKLMVAIFIKEGFISFGSLFKYFSPNDEEMNKLENDYKQILDDEVNKAGANALALAAPLLDDEDELSKPKEKSHDSTKIIKDPKEAYEESLHTNMKYQFLRSFLSTGLYYPSIFLLTKYPFLAYADNEIIQLLNRVSSQIISSFYNEKVETFTHEEFQQLGTSKRIAFSRPQNSVAYEEFPCTELLSFKATIISFGQKKFRFFYDTWTEGLPNLQTIDDLFKVSREFFKFIGVNISKDLSLFVRLCEIISQDLTNNCNGNENEERKLAWFNYFRNYILPAMTIIEEDSIAIDKAYQILTFYSLEDRFSIYGELHQVLAKNNPYVKMAYSKAEKSTKSILKRLSKENVRPMMRRLAKVSFSNPLPCFLTILQQIESYDNLNNLVVETARYFSSYGWDNLTTAILMRLTSPGRTGTQDNGMLDRQWLQSLASFIGKICQRYPRAIDIKTLLQYLLKSFHGEDNIGLIVLKEIFISMGGVQTITNLTLQQIDMINCEKSLEKLVYRTIDDARFERYKSGEFLIKTLLEIDGLNELLVLLCQYQNQLITIANANEFPLKVLSSRIDDITAVIRLFLTVTNFFGNLNQVNNVYLPISDLVTKYGVSTEWAFELWRPYLNKDIEEEEENLTENLSESIVSIIPNNILTDLPPTLVMTFWRLSLKDINYSKQLYDTETIKLQSNARSLKDWININLRDKDVSLSAIDKAKQDLYQNEQFLKTLPEESIQHEIQNKKVDDSLVKLSLGWFSSDDNDKDRLTEQSTAFLQACILPRSIHSSFDAVFASRFLFKLHELSPNKFSLLTIFDHLINSKILFGTLFTLTPSEAENLGLFFADILYRLHSWTKQDIFEKEATNLISQEGIIVNYDEFRKILLNYHETILNDIAQALDVLEYMCRRNAITFLKNLLGIYPNVEDHCERVVELIQKVISEEDREDLKLSSSALIGHVKSRSKEWVHIWDFIPMEEEEKQKLIEERNQKEQAILEAKKKLEEERIRKELERKAQQVAKAKEEEEKKRLATQLNYDSQKPVSRPDSRGTSTQRGRYDNYANTRSDNSVPPHSDDKKSSITKEDQKKSSIPISVAKFDDEKNGDKKEEVIKVEKVKEVKDSEPPKSSSSQEGILTPQGSQTSRSSTPDKLKDKLAQAKKELEASRSSTLSKEDVVDRNVPIKRTPLPPQHEIRANDYKSSSRQPGQSQDPRGQNRGYGQYNKDNYTRNAPSGPGNSNRNNNNNSNNNNNGSNNNNTTTNNRANRSANEPDSSLPVPPPPPPPLASGRNDGYNRNQRFNGRNDRNSSNNRRFEGNKRDGGNYHDRGYDKKTRY
ncbi:transcription factor/nuclear export subunit protein 2-domain-containing protein [Scheffersomyces amazonensis]|uniref:transcription factor/nuclear export subunit protein 2-domain-containing protein n=1 Tax=Scheffersomyces amazonensis TaxID=1078765 RepID=UPI00315D8CFC